MSPTVSERPASASCDEGDEEAGVASGAWRWITVVGPESIAPVASSSAAPPATIRPPTAPATRLAERRFIRRDGRGGLLIRRKPRVRRQREQPADARDGPRPLRERTPQGPSVARRRRRGPAGRGVALLAQQADVASCLGPRGHAQAALEL